MRLSHVKVAWKYAAAGVAETECTAAEVDNLFGLIRIDALLMGP